MRSSFCFETDCFFGIVVLLKSCVVLCFVENCCLYIVNILVEVPYYVVGFVCVGFECCFLVGYDYFRVVGLRGVVCKILILYWLVVCFQCRGVCFLLCMVTLVCVVTGFAGGC